MLKDGIRSESSTSPTSGRPSWILSMAIDVSRWYEPHGLSAANLGARYAELALRMPAAEARTPGEATSSRTSGDDGFGELTPLGVQVSREDTRDYVADAVMATLTELGAV